MGKWFKEDKRSVHLWPDAEEANQASIEQAGGVVVSPTPSSLPIPANEKKFSGFGSPGSISGSVSGTSPLYNVCHHPGNTTIVETQGLTFGGGKGFEVKKPRKDTKLVLDLGGAVDFSVKPFITKGPAWLCALSPQSPAVNIPIARLDWPDRSEPPVPTEWWTKLLKTLVKELAPGHVIVACIGSHGRTGTALAALLLTANPKMTVESAVELVRTHHCEKAIESAKQMQYLCKFRRGAEFEEWIEEECIPPTYTGSTTPYTVGGVVYGGQKGANDWCMKEELCLLTKDHKGECRKPSH